MTYPLYRAEQERDACGTGFVADISGKPSHRILEMAITAVTNLTHRGALDADAKTGDGAGVSFQVPKAFFAEVVRGLGREVAPEDVAVGMVFLPQDADDAGRARHALTVASQEFGLRVFGWRQVPVDGSVLGDSAQRSQPRIEQILLGRPDGADDMALERACYLARKRAEAWAREHAVSDFYVASMSARTIVYKGLLVAHQLNKFYADLRDPRFETALAVFHQRYSTNTFPNWILAQPFRFLAHNGEINTLQGNCNWTKAREPDLASPVWGEQAGLLRPLIQDDTFSDSARLDNVLEAVYLSGRDVLHTLMMLVPEAWENMPAMPANRKDFYEYHACLSEPWDGPASLAFTDGVIVGAALDRNGLRPARYVRTADGTIVMGSEVGMVPLDDADIVEKGRIGPGQMIAVDTAKGRLLLNDEIKDEVANRRPYGAWVRQHRMQLDEYLRTCAISEVHPPDQLDRLQAAFGFTKEELQYIIRPMAAEAKEAVWSMGDDTPLAVLDTHRKQLYNYFKQKFAQVTNPPIDPIREELVMSLDTYLGPRRNLFAETPEHARLMHLNSPLMIDEEVDAIRGMDNGDFASATLHALFRTRDGAEALGAAVRRLCDEASAAVDEGKNILIISDRGVDANNAAIPMLLAVGAVHHHLIRAGKRMRASIIAETADARNVHQIACLIGYGASAVNPYLAFATISEMFFNGDLKGEPDVATVQSNYNKAIDAGLLKIMSKMGISTVSAYHGAQIFEAVGLGPEVMELAFAGTPSRVGGIGLKEIAEDVLERHRMGFGTEKATLPVGGHVRYRKDGEYHLNSPEVVRLLHKASMETHRYEDYDAYRERVENRPPTVLRDLLDFVPLGPSISPDEVEPAEGIMRRFATGAMSLGALSPETHETISIAMNRIGGKANTGEGGEETRRMFGTRNGDDSNSYIKQVASGRFGVTTWYLAAARELEIKMAQGSKPGEGGQLPGTKVSPYIAEVRHTLPGTPLISPPPHHDIYSIEDLAQLIYDLKQVNPRARIAVKLVAEEGVGTIAAGVAKGYADVIQISGESGGTGASPLSSIKHAGLPWEVGLAETQQVLVMNDLRSRVIVRVDGGLHTGRDVVIAALMGAEEFGFGTVALIALGCQMARQCHLNTCPVGIASQRMDLRKKFKGVPDDLVTYFSHVAQEVRQYLAYLGARTLDEIVGRVDLLKQVPRPENERAQMLDLSPLIGWDPAGRPRLHLQERNDRAETTLDDRILFDAQAALDHRVNVELNYAISNTNRTVGARVAGEVAHRYQDAGLPEGTIVLNFRGSAGQSFGAFNHRGIRLQLRGEANDYVGKGMAGGEIAIRPPEQSTFASHEQVIIGNTCLYGATGGSLFAAGRAGERFAVRNSGAKAVVEGTGDHACEYMTEGVVVILGSTGRNFGAGMSNGIAYVLDEDGDFPGKLNPELVAIKRVATRDADGNVRVRSPEDEEMMRSLIMRHVQLTGSRRGKEILENWEYFQPMFWKVAPHAAMTEDGPMTIISRHLNSIREALEGG
ncbi:MAG TPA: glutamate synthase large subunit [Dehalococcoidia bacterium]|nr:glutamate synthase large subunit [Dehalococcoidia bacterium]